MVARMVRKVQRLGAGPLGVAAGSWRASSPGAWRSRSRIASASVGSKSVAARAALLMGEHARQALRLIAPQPGIHGVRVAGAQQALAGHGMRRLAGGDFE